MSNVKEFRELLNVRDYLAQSLKPPQSKRKIRISIWGGVGGGVGGCVTTCCSVLLERDRVLETEICVFLRTCSNVPGVDSAPSPLLGT